MAFLALAIGAILIVAAIRNSHTALFSALHTDVPGFVVWAAAIFAIAALGFVPSLKPVSRALLVLVFVVIILKNYQNILSGFENAWKGAQAQANQSSPSTSTSSKTTGSIWDLIPQLFGSDSGSLSTDSFGSQQGVNG